MKPETWAIVGGRPERVPGAPLNTPLVPASNFVLGTERLYSRTEATETWEAFEEVLGGLEGGHAVSFSSGMAACNAVLSQLPTGAHLVIPDDCYQGVAGIADAGARDHAWQVERVPAPDTETWIAKLLEADLVWLESPTNPLLDVADVAAICAAPRKDGVRIVVDNTFATPLLQQPLSLGADVVVHAATKFLGGHSDLLMGAAVAKDQEQRELLITARKLYGATPGVLEAFLATRGVRTLPVRLKTAIASAVELAARLEAHPAVQRVRYPGFGAVVSFELADAETVDRACAAIKIIWQRHQPRRRRDDDGAPQRPPGPGAHPGRTDPHERRLRGRRRPLGRPRASARRALIQYRPLTVKNDSFSRLAGMRGSLVE